MTSDYQHLGVESHRFFQSSEQQRQRTYQSIFFSAGLVEDVKHQIELDLCHDVFPLSSELKKVFFQLPLPEYLLEKVSDYSLTELHTGCLKCC